jgi:DTW domain-containing protein YfiP
VQRVANRTPVWLLQHPRERFHPIGTARIARLGLERVQLHVMHRQRAAPELPPGAALLYPADDAPDLAALAPAARPSTLVVVDGTWAHARAMVRDHGWLGALPRVGLQPTAASRYRLRKEPALECVSTIEAIVQALRILEPSTEGLDGLLASFEAMIDDQLAIIERRRRGRRRPAVIRTRGGIPLSLFGDRPVVAVAAEAAPKPRSGSGERLIAQLVAQRLDTGERFERFGWVPPERFPNPCHLEHMAIHAASLQRGCAPAELRRAWTEFVADDDLLVAWKQGTLELLGEAVGTHPRRLPLKSAYCSHVKGPCGSLRGLLERLGARPHRAPLSGRAGDHLSQLVALIDHLRAPDSD